MHTSKIGIVLSSGGGRGIFAHTGFLLALEELGVTIAASAGCSAGAIVGGVAASGSNINDWAQAIAKVSNNNFWKPKSLLQLLYGIFIKKGKGLTGLSENRTAIKYCAEHVTAKTFEQCNYPFYALAVNLGTGKKSIFNSGELAPRIMASAAMPLFYEPVEIYGEYFTDGAIIDLAPTDAICCRHNLDVLIVHHVSQHNYTLKSLQNALRKPWSIVEILHRIIYRSTPWYISGEPSSIHKCPCGCDVKILVIEPTLPDLFWPMTKGADAIIDSSKKQAVTEMQPILDFITNQPDQLTNYFLNKAQ